MCSKKLKLKLNMDCMIFIKTYGNSTIPRLCLYSGDVVNDYGQQVETKLDYGTKEEVLNNILGVVSGMKNPPTTFIIIRPVPTSCKNKLQLEETMSSLTSEDIVAFLTEQQ